jgi:hypothetical protein
LKPGLYRSLLLQGKKADKFYRAHKKKISDFKTLDQKSHAQDYFVYPQNISPHLAADEVSLSKRELCTFVTSKAHKINKRKVVVVNGRGAKKIIEVLNKISKTQRNTITEVSQNMRRNM